MNNDTIIALWTNVPMSLLAVGVIITGLLKLRFVTNIDFQKAKKEIIRIENETKKEINRIENQISSLKTMLAQQETVIKGFHKDITWVHEDIKAFRATANDLQKSLSNMLGKFEVITNNKKC
jgi:septal ring factor EnvC (AmiA/AmiB activator)